MRNENMEGEGIIKIWSYWQYKLIDIYLKYY